MMLFSVSALAYIDPAAMTFMIQIFAGIAIAVGATFGLYFRKVKKFFKRLFSKEGGTTDNWEYDENDSDETGYGDYPIDESIDAVWPAEAPEEGLPEFEGEITFEMTDKYDEKGGYTPEKEIQILRKMLASEKSKVEKLTEALNGKA